MTKLPQWKCHKVVGAAKIYGIYGNRVALALVETEDAASGFDVDVTPDWIERHKPQVGGYYVEYDDGYTSFSPAEAFEKGYTLVDGPPGSAPKWPLPASTQKGPKG